MVVLEASLQLLGCVVQRLIVVAHESEVVQSDGGGQVVKMFDCFSCCYKGNVIA